MEDNKNSKIKFFIILGCALFILGMFNGYYGEKAKEEIPVEEAKVNQTFEEPYDDEELEAPETIDIEYYKNKSDELYKLVGKEQPENYSKYFENIAKQEEMVEECYKNLSEYSTVQKVDGKVLKEILSEVVSLNERKIEEIGEYNGGAYINAAISEDNSNGNPFKRSGFNDVEATHELIDLIKEDSSYYVEVLRKYDILGLISLEVKVFDNYLDNENYVQSSSIEPMYLSELDRSLLDIFITDEPVSGKIVKACLDEIIAYNSKRDDKENAVKVSIDATDDGNQFHEYDKYEIEDIENIKAVIDKNKDYNLSRTSGGRGTKYGYMYTYTLKIREVE